MGFFDLISLILDNLGRRKARVGLTAIGVVIGTAAVVVLVSLGFGLQQNATRQLYGIGDLSLINVEPNYNFGGPGGGPVMVAVEAGGREAPPEFQPITNETLANLAAIPGVVAVVPRDWMQGEAILQYNRLETWGGITGMGTSNLATLGMTAQRGVTTLERGTMVIGVNVPNNFYSPVYRPGQEPPPPPDLLDQTVRLALIKYDNEGNQIRKTVPVRVAGILTETRSDPDWSMYMNLSEVDSINQWFSGRRINRNKDGYSMTVVKVADVKDVIEITDQITNMGYMAFTMQSYVEGINSFFLILQIIFGGVGAISLLVAAIGIANTMAMAILERTREIGLMKAVGATNRDVLSVFLGEASGIGFLGGLGGALLGWSAGQVMNVLVMAYMAGQAVEQGSPPPETAVITPLWLPVFAIVFATLVGLLSGLYPALRAATLVPVNALKYE